MTTKRWEHIDLTRAIAVISVVAYHFLRIDEIEGINTVINTYFLSIFFFLSGFLLRPEADKAWIIKKAKRLLVPLVAFTILYIPILSLCKGELIGTTLSDMFRSESKGGYWFVYTLFSAMALIWLIHYIYSVFALPKRLYPVLLILPWVIAFALSIFLPQEISYWLSIPSFRRYYLFILLGMLCQEIRPHRYFTETISYATLGGFYLLFIVLSLWKFQTVDSNLSFAVWFMANVFGCLFITETCRRICQKHRIHRLTQWLSEDSLGIYLVQFIIREVSRKPFMSLTLSPYISFIPYTIVLLTASLTITRLIRKNKKTTKIFLGQ
jgi:peptidoglycan/LPS O-acetylase OafA/YrhL